MHKTKVHWVWIQIRNVLLWIPWYKLQKQSTFPSVHLSLWKTADTSKSGPWFDFLSTTGLSLVSIGKFMIITMVKDYCLFLNVQLQGGIYGVFYESKFANISFKSDKKDKNHKIIILKTNKHILGKFLWQTLFIYQ